MMRSRLVIPAVMAGFFLAGAAGMASAQTTTGPMPADVEACKQTADRPKAIEACGKVISAAGKDGTVLSATYASRASALLASGKGKEALSDLTRALSWAPQNTALWTQRGDVRAKLGQRIRSAADYSVALKYDAKNVAALVGRGDQYRLLGILPKAVEDATEALKLDPKNATALANRAYALVRQGKDADAIKDADEAIKLDAKATQAYLARGIARMKADKAAATADVKKALELEPGSTVGKAVLKQLGG